MALWITSGKGEEKGNIFLVNPSEWLTCVPKPERWAEARRISLMYNRISKLPKKPRCRNLQTLLLNDNDNNFHPEEIRLKFPLGFFQFMRRLRVLDLSYRSIRLLPSGIGSLVELRFLDLSGTLLESLPMEVGRLTKLRQLRLEHVSYLTSIPREAVLSLKGLQSLNLLESDYVFTGDWEDDGSDSGSAHDEGQLSLRDLEGMGQLTELGVSIRGMTQRGMEDLQKSHRLCASIRFLSLEYVGISSFDLSAFLEVMKGLRKLTINFSPDLEDLVFNKNQLSELEELSLFNLSRATVHWKDGNVFVTGPTTAGIFKTFGQLPCIEKLTLFGCSRIEEVIVVEEVTVDNVDYENDSFFPKLKRIWLEDLPNLRSICRHPLLLPSLEEVHVINCPELKKLPFGFSTAKNIKEIYGGQEWWDGLEWEHEDVRSMFTPFFPPLNSKGVFEPYSL
ncbi:unnamed protein product [Spirodela intermedia]|uniref:Disease resistance R13L4/SHOC-2-like LRR domain-containing protein n=1 Tax=Spirodela intermedia TaxID=51605 RepID=A0A7I8LKB1_SPIIN|nr:unnamed protein product [Spirodela intermedia]